MANTDKISLTNDISASIQKYAKDCKDKADEKEVVYQEALEQVNLFALYKNRARAKFMSEQLSFKKTGIKSSFFSQYESNYNLFASKFSNAEINADVAHDSLANSVFHAAKMNTFP